MISIPCEKGEPSSGRRVYDYFYETIVMMALLDRFVGYWKLRIIVTAN